MGPTPHQKDTLCLLILVAIIRNKPLNLTSAIMVTWNYSWLEPVILAIQGFSMLKHIFLYIQFSRPTEGPKWKYKGYWNTISLSARQVYTKDFNTDTFSSPMHNFELMTYCLCCWFLLRNWLCNTELHVITSWMISYSEKAWQQCYEISHPPPPTFPLSRFTSKWTV